ncbi:unnamed protein product [Mytilus edulis]|uniref:PHD-type domain-containing protein n=1 Tax=Mytilus edulis TaxID=6550 RepID=A0A8S3R781_MYTED|nr:unnamed protein product [Mytilus edulis]
MAAGSGGLKIALLIFGFFARLQPEKSNHSDLNEVKADNLGFYACSQTSRENELDFVIQIFCPSQLDYSQHGRPEKISLEHRKIKSSSKFCFILTILLCGDIHINPGPIKHPCTDCKKSVRSNQKAFQCDFCDNWTHLKCTNISTTQYHILSTSDDTFYCYECSQRLPNFTESFFNDTFSQSCSTSFNLSGSSQNGTINIVNSDSGDEHQYDIFSELNEARRKHPDTFSCAYLNINSLRYKFCSIKELLCKNTVDMLIIAETKIDDSFPDALFKVDNFHFWRKDRTSHGGGLVMYVRSDIACDRKDKFELKFTESIMVEMHINNRKWLIAGLYRPPSIKDDTFKNEFICTCDKLSTMYDNFLLLDDSESEFEINTVESSEINMVQSKIFAKMLLIDQNKQIKFQLDSGATANLIPKSLVYESLIEETDNTLTMYNKSQLSAYGICTLRLKNPKTNKRYNVKFIVVGDEYTPLLGSKAIQQMNLIKIQFHNILTYEKGDNVNDFSMQNIVKEYADIFDGEGSFQGHLHLEIDETITPVKSPLRRIPIAMKPKLKSELHRLETNGVIKAVDTPTDWVSSLVTVKKPNGKLRICIDPKPLNKALKRSHYPLPIIDDLLPELNKAKIFSKCDVKNGFWHVNMDKSSSYLTTFETPFGRFRWMKMPFGISPAPEYFQQFLEREIENLPGVRTVADDILIYGEGDTVEEATADHDIKLKAFLDRCRSRNINLNRDKFQYMYIADTLSRAYLNNVKNKSEKQDEICHVRSDIEIELENINMGDYLAISAKRQKDIADATMKDPILLKLIDKVAKGWTEINIQQDIAPYYHIRDELSIQGGIIFKGDRCVIPKCMRTEILEQIHTHIGIEGCLKRARECVYWPRMNSEIRDYISKCETCQSYGMKQQKETLVYCRIAPESKKQWEKGIVTDTHSARSYDLRKENGQMIRRNRQAVRKTNEQYKPYNEPENIEINIDVPKTNNNQDNQNETLNNSRHETESVPSDPMVTRFGRKDRKTSKIQRLYYELNVL